MANYQKVREMVSHKIGKIKKKCRKAFKSNFLFLILCWSITGIVAFAAWGVYVFFDFAGFFLDLEIDFIGIGISLVTFLPLLLGNVNICKKIIKGKKVDIYMLFDYFFSFKKFWKWIGMYVIYLCPGWLFTLALAFFSRDTERLLPFFGEKTTFYVSVFFEVTTLLLFFFNMCRSIYFISAFDICENEETFFEKTEDRYSKKKKYFKKYVLSHAHYLIILFFAGLLPFYITAPVYVFVFGYIVLSFVAFSEGFGINFKKNKIRRPERYEREVLYHDCHRLRFKKTPYR